MSDQQKNGFEIINSELGPLAQGIAVIAGYLKTLPSKPGVYRMINAGGQVLYVGKAKRLKHRVTSYTQPQRISLRIQRMVSETASMEFILTHTEAEALLLEANLIKELKPRYNILLRDDKSFPQILLRSDHDFPQVLKHRGTRRIDGEYFGPFASAWAVNETLNTLQRAFLLRTCTDATFSSRTRPCLLFQIKRCSAPCVDRISKGEYGKLVGEAARFLRGESRAIQEDLAKRMQAASDELDFEAAAQYRDRIRAMTRIQQHQDIHVEGLAEADVIAIHREGANTCIQVFFFRAGCNYGNRAYYPSHSSQDETAEILEAFLGQFYASKPPPKLILLSEEIPEPDLLMEALAVRAGHRVEINVPKRGDKTKLIKHAFDNARTALSRRLAESASQRQLLNRLADILDMESPPERIEVYDNSHIQGTNAVGAMIVAGLEGFIKNAYRKFNIKYADNVSPSGSGGYSAGDDYAMMREVLTRRFARALKEDPERQSGNWPDLLLIDGGLGQLNIAREVFADLGIDGITLAGVAKGPDRNAGREKIFLPDQETAVILEADDPVLYYIQRLRDEAHRFAIGTHRDRRSAKISKSVLDDIPGIGAKRKKALLHHFGSARAVSQAGLQDLETVEGISKATAQQIYDHFHSPQ